MIGTEPTAYSTNDPVTVAAFRAARDAEMAFARKVAADAAALGKNKGALRTSSVFSGGYTTVGLAPDDPDNAPAGWVYSKGRDALVPRRGKVGDGARQWLKDHQPTRETRLRDILAEHGLPLNDMRGSTRDGSTRFGVPAIGIHNDELWALYKGTPGLWCAGDKAPQITWTPRKLSEYYAAMEAAQAADEAGRTEPVEASAP